MAILGRPVDREFNTEAEPGARFDAGFMNDLVDTHSTKIAPRYRHWQALYEGRHKILRKDRNRGRDAGSPKDPNNIVVNDFFGQVIDNTVGYFLGNPVVIRYTEPVREDGKAEPNDVGADVSGTGGEKVQEWIDSVLLENDFPDTVIEWGKEAMVKGLSHLLIYQDENSQTKVMRVSPENMVLVYKNSATKELQYAIRLYDIDTEDTKKTRHYAEVYSAGRMELFESTDTSGAMLGADAGRVMSGYAFVEERPLIYDRIPVVTLYNNEEQMSDLEKIESLVDDYDKVLSDASDEFSVFRNAYLVLKNMVVDERGKQQIKEEHILELMQDGDAKFLTKQIQTDALENHLNRLEANIYKFSQVPNLSDESFAGNLSGVAIRFKLFGLETKCIIKERKMEKALKDFLRVLSVPIRVATGQVFDITNVRLEFSRNVPNNLTEIVDTVTKLEGKVDKETLLSLLPFVDSPKDVLDKMAEDEQAARESVDPYNALAMAADAERLFGQRTVENALQERF